MSDQDPPTERSHGRGLEGLLDPDLAAIFWQPPLLGTVSAWWEHVPFAQWLIPHVRPGVFVELGTHAGVSYSAFCESVMRCGLDTRCSAVDTWKGDDQAGYYDTSVLPTLRAFHDLRYGAFSELIQSTFDEAAQFFRDGTIDLLHIDGFHTYDAVAGDFTTWLPKLSERAVVLFHDTNVRRDDFGVWKFWEEVSSQYPSFTFLHSYGLGVLAVGNTPPDAIKDLCALQDARAVNSIRERFARVGERWRAEYRLNQQAADFQVQQGSLRQEIAKSGALSAQQSDRSTAHLGELTSELEAMRLHAANQDSIRAALQDALDEEREGADILRQQVADMKRQIDVPQLAGRRPYSSSNRFSSRRSTEILDGTTTVDPSASTNGNARSMRRACIFSFYDEHGVVDDYVVYFLKELGAFVEHIIFYSNGPLTRDSEIKLRGCIAELIRRPNEGYDVLAYKEGLEKLGFGDNDFDEIIMANHTCYGPVFPFAELFEEMERRTCDFWGVTAHMAMTPNPLTGTGTLPFHINANFIAVRRDMLLSQMFRQYWSDIRASPTYEEAIVSHEAVFTDYFTKLGYKVETYLDCTKYGTHYPAILDIDETLLDRNPLVKRRAFFHDPRFLECYAADLPRALRVLRDTSDYDQSLIWRNIVRSADLRTLNTNAALTSVLPEVRVKQDEPLPACGRVAVCVHVYYTEMLEEILALTATIPLPFDFIATTESEAKKAIIEQTVTGRGKIQNVIVRVVEQNRGRDMSALFVTCRDLFLDGPYDLVCRLHTKKSPQVAAGRGNLFKRHMFENLLHSEGYTTNVLDMFQENPWIGVAVPPVVQISYWTLGHAWYNNKPRAEEVARLLDLKVRFDPDTPIAAYGTMFWFRPKALRKLFAHPWKWTDYNAEPHHVDGGLAHVQERLICYVAQDAGYTTQQILNADLAGWNYGVLEYKLQKLSAALPNSDFSYQAHMLESWKDAGYPMGTQPAFPIEHPAIRPDEPSSVSRSFGELLLATKKSMLFRSPTTFKVLRPVYRAAVGRGRRSPPDAE